MILLTKEAAKDIIIAWFVYQKLNTKVKSFDKDLHLFVNSKEFKKVLRKYQSDKPK